MVTLEGRRALVCGSTQGIGRACAEEIARAGAEVILLARSEERLREARGALPAAKGQRHGYEAVDFGDWQAVRDAAKRVVASTGPIQILVNNTGGPPAGTAHEAAPEAYAAAFAQHLLCNQCLLRETLPGMKEAGYGRIINVISSSVITPIKGLGVSNTIRGAVANWAKTLATELAPFGVTVNNILPGFVDTTRLASLIETKAEKGGVAAEQVKAEMVASVPAGRFGEPAELGRVAAFLASPAASYVNGVNLPVDGGRLSTQ